MFDPAATSGRANINIIKIDFTRGRSIVPDQISFPSKTLGVHIVRVPSRISSKDKSQNMAIKLLWRVSCTPCSWDNIDRFSGAFMVKL